MSLGRLPNQEDLHRSTRAACEARLGPKAIERLLARECHRLFPDEEFADLFAVIGRDSATDVTAGNVADGAVAETLVGPELAEAKKADANEPVEIYGDASYGTADLVEKMEAAPAPSRT